MYRGRDHRNTMNSAKTKIMVVEDDIPASTFIAEVLVMQGYDAVVVNESWKAMEVADSTSPQAFLLDLMMPPPDGFKLCRMLRAHPSFKYTPILIVTALDNTDSKIVAIGAGANDYLVKPFRIDDLTSKVKDLLGE